MWVEYEQHRDGRDAVLEHEDLKKPSDQSKQEATYMKGDTHMKLNRNHRMTKALAFTGLIFASMHTAYAQETTDPALDKIVEDTADDAFGVALGLVVLAGVGIYFIVRNKRDDRSFTQLMENYQNGLMYTLDESGSSVRLSMLGARPNRQVFRNDFHHTGAFDVGTFDTGAFDMGMGVGTFGPRLSSGSSVEVLRASWNF